MEVDSVTISQWFSQLCLGNDDLSFSLSKTFKTLSSFFFFYLFGCTGIFSLCCGFQDL